MQLQIADMPNNVIKHYYLTELQYPSPVLKKRWKPQKLDKKTSGPYRVLQTHVNGTVTKELRPGVLGRLNIQRVILYKE
jgi:hypothetical protein